MILIYFPYDDFNGIKSIRCCLNNLFAGNVRGIIYSLLPNYQNFRLSIQSSHMFQELDKIDFLNI